MLPQPVPLGCAKARFLEVPQGEHKAPTYAARSLTMRVPSITDGDFHLCESSAICEYLDESHPGTGLYPTDLKSRAKAREVQAWLRSDLMPIRVERPTEFVLLQRKPPPLSPEALGAARKLFAAVDSLLAAHEQCLFKAWSIADTDLALMLNRLVLAGDEVPSRLADFARFQWQRPSVQAWVNMPRPGA